MASVCCRSSTQVDKVVVCMYSKLSYGMQGGCRVVVHWLGLGHTCDAARHMYVAKPQQFPLACFLGPSRSVCNGGSPMGSVWMFVGYYTLCDVWIECWVDAMPRWLFSWFTENFSCDCCPLIQSLRPSMFDCGGIPLVHSLLHAA